MGAIVKILFLGLSLSAQPMYGMYSKPLLLHENETTPLLAKTKDAVELPFLGIASCAFYRFCNYHHKPKNKIAELTSAKTEIESSSSKPSTKPKAFTPCLTIIVPSSPVSSIRFCSSRPTPRSLADGKFTFW